MWKAIVVVNGMRKAILILIILIAMMSVVWAQEPGAIGIGDPYFETLGNGGYDAQHYTLDLTVDMDENVISGTVTMDAVATQDLSVFNLDFLGFQISKITVDDLPADYLRKESELSITPPESLAAGESFAVDVTYSGVPGDDIEGLNIFSAGWTRYKAGVYVAGEPAGASRWYPVNDHPRDKATYTFRITVPEPYVVAANGLLQDSVDNGDTTTYTWDMNQPMASYLATVNIADFALRTQDGPDGLPIRNYFPARLADDAPVVFERTPEMIAYFNEIFGPYPFEAYGVVMADTSLFFALETQSMSLFGAEIVPNAITDAIPRWSTAVENVVAHELAHQWFGDSVSPANWQDIWLNEGFASYASALWIEHTQGQEAFEAEMKGYYSAIDSRNYSPGEPPPDDLFNRGVYLQGAWTLHALRLEVGDEVFFNILRTYYDRFKYANASTADFMAVSEEVSGQDLSALFEAWLFAGGVPPVPEMGLKP
jgi:aminopeptidase N